MPNMNVCNQVCLCLFNAPSICVGQGLSSGGCLICLCTQSMSTHVLHAHGLGGSVHTVNGHTCITCPWFGGFFAHSQWAYMYYMPMVWGVLCTQSMGMHVLHAHGLGCSMHPVNGHPCITCPWFGGFFFRDFCLTLKFFRNHLQNPA